MGMLVKRNMIFAAAGGLLALAACNNNARGDDSALSGSDIKADAMQANASAMRDEATTWTV